jgi:hypothetical protein
MTSLFEKFMRPLLCFLALFAVSVAAEAIQPDDEGDQLSVFLHRNTSLDEMNVENRAEEVNCQVPEGYYLFNVKSVSSDNSMTGGVFLEKEDKRCHARFGVVSVCSGSPTCLQNPPYWHVKATKAVQKYASSTNPSFEFTVIGTSYVDKLAVVVRTCSETMFGYLERAYLRDDDDHDAFDALRKFGCSFD